MNKKKLMHILMRSLKENWCSVNINKNGKVTAWTDSEIAANALTEILYDIGLEEYHDPNTKNPDYRRDDIVINGCWRASFDEL